MKRICFGLLLLCAACGMACNDQSNNNNAAANVNASPNTNASPTLGNTNDNPRVEATKFNEVVVTITIADKDGKPIIMKVDPEPVTLNEGQHVQWVVDNQSKIAEAEGATIEVGPFVGKNNPSDTKPFGPTACDNTFDLLSVSENSQSRSITNPFTPKTGETQYKYTITLKQADGKPITSLDPQIIVGVFLIKPKTGTAESKPPTSASPAPSPKASPTKPKK